MAGPKVATHLAVVAWLQASMHGLATNSCESCKHTDDTSLMQLARKTIIETLASDGTGACGDPSWFLPNEECEGPDSPDAWGNRRRKTYTPPNASCPNATAYPWCNSNEELSARVDKLVAEMSFDELLAQVSCDIFSGVPAIERLGVNQYNYIRENDHGLLWNDVCPVPTMFPQVITMAASFNKTLWKAAGVASAIETRYNYNIGKQNSLFTQTNLNIFLDPRWGRGQEVPGEDPFLNTVYGMTWVSGVQAPQGPGGVPLVASSCKHFTAYSLEGAGGWAYPFPDSNRHNFNAVVAEVDLADTHFPMYQGCAEAGALGMMTSYNAINGVPMAANGAFTNGLARKGWGFKGAVVTDCGAVEDLWLRHKYVSNATQAAQAALSGGTDIECGNTIKKSATPAMKPLLERAVKASFGVRFRTGEFDVRPTPNLSTQLYDQGAHAKLAYEAAVQGAVLLKNDDKMLPLSKGIRLAVVGPLKHGTWEVLGNYAAYKNGANWSDSPNIVTPVQGLQNCDLGHTLVVSEGGPYVCSPTDQVIPGTNHAMQKPEADVVLIVAGLYCQDEQMQDPDRRPELSGKCMSGCLESEGCDRPGLSLPRGQRQLIKRAASWGLPVVLVLISGGMVDLENYVTMRGVKSILWMGYPGQAAGTAMARLLFGLESPSGRLTQTFYRGSYADALSIKDMNMRADAKKGYPGRTYRFVDPAKWVVYPFGYGLSYHQWKYSWAKPAAATGSRWQCSLSVTAAVTNSGGFTGTGEPETSVLLFLLPPSSAGPLAPRTALRAFDRVRGKKGTVTFELREKDFQLAGADGKFSLVTGTWLAELAKPSTLAPHKVKVTPSGCECPWSK